MTRGVRKEWSCLRPFDRDAVLLIATARFSVRWGAQQLHGAAASRPAPASGGPSRMRRRRRAAHTAAVLITHRGLPRQIQAVILSAYTYLHAPCCPRWPTRGRTLRARARRGTRRKASPRDARSVALATRAVRSGAARSNWILAPPPSRRHDAQLSAEFPEPGRHGEAGQQVYASAGGRRARARRRGCTHRSLRRCAPLAVSRRGVCERPGRPGLHP